MGPVSERKFKIGQSLFYYPEERLKANGRYVVIRLLTQPDGEALPD
jgi:hypothetical protein